MKAKKNGNRLYVAVRLMVLLCAMAIIPFTGLFLSADAAENTADLTVTWEDEGQALVLYRVATRNSKGGFDLTDEFKDYGIDILGISDEKAENAAQLLAIYATRDKLTPLDELTTDSSGKHVFADLEYGAYIAFNKATVSKNKISIVPVFVFLEKDMEVMLKPLEDTSTSCKVYKIWDDNNSKSRPASIVVQLLRGDGTVYDEQTLSDKNNWFYSWTDLPEDKYRIAEKEVPSGYKLTAGRSKDTWKLTNKKTTTPPDEDTPDDGDDTPSNSKKIPKTGQLWWPVPVLLSAGFLCMIIGLLRRRRQGTD